MQLPGSMIPKQNIKMEIEFSAGFRKQYHKTDVRIRHKIDNCLRIFKSNPNDLQLNNHELRKEWIGYRSIDITSDYRALYIEKSTEEDTVAYFTIIGTHDELYGKPKN